MHNPFCDYKYDILPLYWVPYYVRVEMSQAFLYFLIFCNVYSGQAFRSLYRHCLKNIFFDERLLSKQHPCSNG